MGGKTDRYALPGRAEGGRVEYQPAGRSEATKSPASKFSPIVRADISARPRCEPPRSARYSPPPNFTPTAARTFQMIRACRLLLLIIHPSPPSPPSTAWPSSFRGGRKQKNRMALAGHGLLKSGPRTPPARAGRTRASGPGSPASPSSATWPQMGDADGADSTSSPSAARMGRNVGAKCRNKGQATGGGVSGLAFDWPTWRRDKVYCPGAPRRPVVHETARRQRMCGRSD